MHYAVPFLFALVAVANPMPEPQPQLLGLNLGGVLGGLGQTVGNLLDDNRGRLTLRTINDQANTHSELAPPPVVVVGDRGPPDWRGPGRPNGWRGGRPDWNDNRGGRGGGGWRGGRPGWNDGRGNRNDPPRNDPPRNNPNPPDNNRPPPSPPRQDPLPSPQPAPPPPAPYDDNEPEPYGQNPYGPAPTQGPAYDPSDVPAVPQQAPGYAAPSVSFNQGQLPGDVTITPRPTKRAELSY